MSTITTTVQTISIASALLGAGGIACISVLDFRMLRSQPASRSLPMIRWLFSRGSHIFPQSAEVATVGFAYLAYLSLPATTSLPEALAKVFEGGKVSGYVAAAGLAISIAPWTRIMMVPTNFALMAKNEELGGSRSAKSKEERNGSGGAGSADDSVAGEGQSSEFTDLSGPQQATDKEASPQEQQRVTELIDKFIWLNYVRAALAGAGGIVGLLTALSQA